MTPLELHTEILDALENVLPGVPVLFAHPDVNAEQVEPWVLLSLNHNTQTDRDDEFGTDDVYQHLTVSVTSFSEIGNPERAMQMAESVRKALAGLFNDELDMGPGRFNSLQAPNPNWFALEVQFGQANYKQSV